MDQSNMIPFLKQRTKRIEHFQANTVTRTWVNMQAAIRFAKAEIFFQIVLKIGLMENTSLAVNNVPPPAKLGGYSQTV